MPARSSSRRPEGVCFPAGGDGHRSTQATGRAVFADSVRTVDPALAARIEHTNDWRRGYLTPVRQVAAAAATSPTAGAMIARDGLASVYRRFPFVRDGAEFSLLDAMDVECEPALGSVEVHGRQPRQPDLSLPYAGRRLFGDDLLRQIDAWVDRGICEPGLAQAIQAVMGHPEWLDLTGVHIAVLGASAQMGPTRSLLRWGATVHAVDLPSPASWQRLIAIARSTSGTLRIPIARDANGQAPVVTSGVVHHQDDDLVAHAAGIDILAGAPQIARWLDEVVEPLVVGSYTYADGATHVLLSVATDAIGHWLASRRTDITLACLATPTDAFVVPQAAVTASRERWADRGLMGLAQSPLRITGQFQPNYPASSDLGEGLAVNDSLVAQQGPNYALAKRIQRWRAIAAAEQGTTVAINLAPATRTQSVLKNRVLAAAYAGADRFGVEVFEPATSTALMAALLVHDLRNPETMPTATGDGIEAFADRAVHGGLWRSAYAPRSVLGIAALLGMFEARS